MTHLDSGENCCVMNDLKYSIQANELKKKAKAQNKKHHSFTRSWSGLPCVQTLSRKHPVLDGSPS